VTSRLGTGKGQTFFYSVVEYMMWFGYIINVSHI
jgi:hypothetical protein